MSTSTKLNPQQFGFLVGHAMRKKQSSAGPGQSLVHPLQSPMAGYREGLLEQRQVEQQQTQQQQAQQAQQQGANLPQGPTATNYPNMAPAQELAPNDIGGQPPAQPKTAALGFPEGLRAKLLDAYQQTAFKGHRVADAANNGDVGRLAREEVLPIAKKILAKAKPAMSAASDGAKSIAGQIAGKKLKQASLGGFFRGLGTAARGVATAGRVVGQGLGAAARGVGAAARVAGQAAPHVARGAAQFGKGVYGAGAPIGGLMTGGFRGAGQGFQTAGRMLRSGPGGAFSPAAAAGMATAGYLGYKSLQNPVVQTGDGVQFRSPVRIPAMRFRSPVRSAGGVFGGGYRVQNPVKVLW